MMLFIGSLETGGAERQALCLARGMADRGLRVHLVSVFPGGNIWDEATKADHIVLHSLFAKKPATRIGRLLVLLWAPIRLRGLSKIVSPDVIYSMLYLSNLFARLALLGAKRKPVLVWGIRASNLQSDYRRDIPFRLCRMLSGGVELHIANSHAGLEFHRDSGFNIANGAVIHNGIDCEQFRFDEIGRQRLREDWGIADDESLVGLVGRLDPMKGHEVFLRTAAKVDQARPGCVFVCVGPGPSEYKQRLQKMARKYGIEKTVVFAGGTNDVCAAYSAMDVVVSASVWGEGFPNVIGEAMACARACVVTDVGDSAIVVGNCGKVVTPNDDEALARSVLAALDAREQMGGCGAERVRCEFSTDALVTRTIRHIVEGLPAPAEAPRKVG